MKDHVWHARIQKIFPGGGGGPNSHKGADGKFQHGKNKFHGGGGADPLSPLWIRPRLDSKYYRNNLCKQVELMYELNCTK